MYLITAIMHLLLMLTVVVPELKLFIQLCLETVHWSKEVNIYSKRG